MLVRSTRPTPRARPGLPLSSRKGDLLTLFEASWEMLELRRCVRGMPAVTAPPALWLGHPIELVVT